jgi:hypothetical protein
MATDQTTDLACTWDQAALNHVRDGVRMSTAAKVAFVEEMLAIAAASGALKRELDRRAREQFDLWIVHEPEHVRRQHGR